MQTSSTMRLFHIQPLPRPRALAALLAAALLAGALPARAVAENVEVDLSTTTTTLSGAGRGFLYGLSQDGSGPGDALLLPIVPRSFRGGGEIDVDGSWGWALGAAQFEPRYAAVRAQAQRVTRPPYSASFDVLVSDLWGSDGSGQRPANIAEPCDDGPGCASWVAFLTTLVGHLRADGLLNSSVRFDIWNEPAANSYFWPRSSSQYYQMWDTGVRTLRSLYPQAIIVGPSLANYDVTTMAGYLDQFVADGTMPTILNWHFSGDPVGDAANARSLMAARGVSGVPISMNEYLFSNQQTPAVGAWYMAQLQRGGYESGEHAIWNNCCGDPTLDQILVPSGGAVLPTGAYWVYQASAAQTGLLAASTGSASVDLVAARDDGARQASVLLGSNGAFGGTLAVRIDGVSSVPWLAGSANVHVQVQRFVQGVQSAPLTVQDSYVPVQAGGLNMAIQWVAPNDAYRLVLDTGTTGGIGITSFDDNVTGTGTNQFNYGSGWGLASGVSDLYAGTAHWASGAGASATLRFSGTRVELHTVHDVDQGIMAVVLDGAAAVNVDDYAPVRAAAAMSWISPVLSPGVHVLTVSATGQRNAASSGTTVAIDRADVDAGTISVDENGTGPGGEHVVYSAGWGVTTGVPDLFAGTAHWSTQGGALAQFTFQGRSVALYAVRDFDQGVMDVSIDGGAVSEVDDYSPLRTVSTPAWTSPLLAAGTHTLSITVTGRRNPASANATIALDRVDFIQ
jgi:hypothetical protein